MTKSTSRRKGLWVLMLSEGESMAITAEGVAAAGTAEAESYTLPDKHETQRELRGGGMGF